MSQPGKKPKRPAYRIPTVRVLCEQLGFGPETVTALTNTTQFWRKQYRTSAGVLGKDLLKWKDPSVQKDLRLMVREYLDIHARLWSPRTWTSDGKSSGLEYPADRDRITDLLCQLFWRQNTYTHRNAHMGSKKRKRDDVEDDPAGQTPTAAGGSIPSENAHVYHHDITFSHARYITPSPRIQSAPQRHSVQCERTRLLGIDTPAYAAVRGPPLSVRETPIPRQRNLSVETVTFSVHSPKTASLPPHSNINGPSGTAKPLIEVRYWIIKSRVPLFERERWKDGKISKETLQSVWKIVSEIIRNDNFQVLKFTMETAYERVIYPVAKGDEEEFRDMKVEYYAVMKAAFKNNTNEMKQFKIEIEPMVQEN